MKTAALLVAGFVVISLALLNGIRFVMAAIQFHQWTHGSYHDPLWTTLAWIGGVSSALVLGFLIVGVVSPGSTLTLSTAIRWNVGFFVFLFAGAVAGLALPFIHVSEADLTASGFQQDQFSLPRNDALTFYNTSPVPVTVCLGAAARCTAGSTGPAELAGPGLTVAPGALVAVTFPVAGEYRITIVGAPTHGDATVSAFLPICEANPDSNFCTDLPQ
jgi:hypothetical protein